MESTTTPHTATLHVKRFSVSVVPQLKMLRVNSDWGRVADQVMVKRGIEPISDDYYTSLVNVHSLEGNTGVVLLNATQENLLQVTATDITFWRSAYTQDGHLSLDRSFDEFLPIWAVVDELLHVRDVRQIRICAAIQLSLNTDANAYLFNIIKHACPVNPRAFRFHYESRKWINADEHKNEVPRVETDAFYNECFTYYAGPADMPIILGNALLASSQLQANDPNKIDNTVNFEYEVQRFYAPLIASGLGTAFARQRDYFMRKFSATKTKILKDVSEGGVTVNE